MLFNSIDFAVFLPIVFLIYWFVVNKNLRLQNFFLLCSGYLFYGWWDWRFLFLILFSTTLDYTIGIALSKQEDQTKRKLLFLVSILVNIGFLGFFKYYNFFADAFVQAFTFFGHPIEGRSLNVILPVGISFYTFQSLAYIADAYQRKVEPSKDIVAFYAYVSFFPQLVAGPIERPKNLLYQFYEKRKFDYNQAADGLRQMLWGFFKKMVIADNCSVYVNDIFNNHQSYSGGVLVVGAILFAFQIYGDFSGYSDIALGTARLIGFNLMRNFAFPYFSRDIAEFWRRWHISLNSWFRDYVYIPLGGSKGGQYKKIRNTFIIFLLSGLWHGANWTFVVWGLLNALFILPLMVFDLNRSNLGLVAEGKIFPSLKEVMQMLLTFSLTVFAWIFFRAATVSQAWDYIKRILTTTSLKKPEVFPAYLFSLIAFLLVVEWFQRDKQHALEIGQVVQNRYVRWAAYLSLAVLILSSANFGKTEFIYFAF